jgi:hypothetical protein
MTTTVDSTSVRAPVPDAPDGADKVLAEHHVEIQRRVAVADSGVSGVATFARVAGIGDDPPLRDPDQRWVLFSVSHEGVPPCALDRMRPALRVYGCFPDQDEARRMADVVAAQDPDCCLQLNRTHEWILACRTLPRLGDAVEVAAKTERLLRAHLTAQALRKDEFDDKVRAMQDDHSGDRPLRETTESDDEDESGTTKAAKEVEADAEAPALPPGGRRALTALPACCDVSGQGVVAMSMVADTEEPEAPEFLFRVYGCFATEVDADRYVRNVASVEVTEFDVDVALTRKWLHLTVPMDVKKEYRSTELTKIMDHHRAQPKRVEAFHRECGMDTPAGLDGPGGPAVAVWSTGPEQTQGDASAAATAVATAAATAVAVGLGESVSADDGVEV